MRIRLALAALALFLLPSAARADTFQITSGAVFFGRMAGGDFVLSGPSFQVVGRTDAVRPSHFQTSLSPGEAGRLSLFADSADTLAFFNSVTANGVTTTPGACGPCQYFRLQFATPAFTAPGDVVSGFVVTAPFTATGSAQLYSGPGQSGNLLFAADFTGAGTASARYVLAPNGGQYLLQSLTYTFGPQAEGVTVRPVPEPATLLLLVTGLAGAAVGARRRRKA